MLRHLHLQTHKYTHAYIPCYLDGVASGQTGRRVDLYRCACPSLSPVTSVPSIRWLIHHLQIELFSKKQTDKYYHRTPRVDWL